MRHEIGIDAVTRRPYRLIMMHRHAAARSPASSSTSPTPRRGRSAPTSPARCSPPTRPTPRSRAPPRRSPRATSRSPRNTDAPARRATTLAERRRAGHRPSLRPEVGGDRQRAARRGSTDAEIDAIEAFVRGGGGLIVLGETEQEKYGNNLNELLARFGIEIENATVQDYEHHPATRRPGCSPTLGDAAGRRAGADLARPRRRGLLLPRRDAGARTTARRVIARTLADRLAAERAARRGHRARRRPGRRARRLRPVRRRLHRRARPRGALAQPRLLGRRSRPSPARAAALDSPAAADPHWAELQATRSRSCA